MANSGVFKLIANDGKADRLIMATALLNQRIKDVMCARRSAGMADITPTLVDLERTHILFVNAHFKPFAAIGYEYQRVRPNSGNPALGNDITFSIPQYGDFFYDMVGHQTLSACQSSLQTAPTQATGGVALGSTQFPAANYDWDNTTQLTTSASVAGVTYDLVDVFGNPVEVSPLSTFRNLVRYCEYPGERLYQSVRFDVNGNPLDEYNDTTINFLRKFTISVDKLTGYKRLVGQEVCRDGSSGPQLCYAADSANNGTAPYTTFSALLDYNTLPSIPNHSVEPVSATSATLISESFPDNAWNMPLTTVDHDPASGAAAYGYLDVVRQCLSVVDGPQTPKYQQPALEIWNKLRFWFCDDVRLAIASVSIPFGQRFITIRLAPQSQLTFEFPGLYIRQTIDSGAWGPVTAGVNARTITYRPYVSPGTISDVTLSDVSLYVNNIFVNPEVHDIFIKRISFSLIRVFRFQKIITNTPSGNEQQLSQLKWPIEYMFVGMRPAWNTSASNAQQWRDWHRMSKVNDIVCDDYDLASVALSAAPAFSAGVRGHISRVGKIVPDTWARSLKSTDTLQLSANGITLYDAYPDTFYNSYLPFHYGGSAIVTPEDEGALMVNFALYPGSYQPSGHLNVSRAREFYVKWTTRYVTAATPAELLVVAKAINFLLITDGSAVLRYST